MTSNPALFSSPWAVSATGRSARIAAVNNTFVFILIGLKGLVFVCRSKSRGRPEAPKIKGAGGAKEGAEGAYPGAESDGSFW